MSQGCGALRRSGRLAASLHCGHDVAHNCSGFSFTTSHSRDVNMPALRRDYHNTRRPPRLAYIRSTLPVLITFVVLSFGLGSYAYLSTFRSPAFTQGLGWQAWDVVAKHAEAHTISNGTAPSLPLDIWVSGYRYRAPRLFRAPSRADDVVAGSHGPAHYRSHRDYHPTLLHVPDTLR